MEKVFKTLLNERVEKYGIDTLMDEETISILTGISIEKVKSFIESFGLPEIIKHASSMEITKTQKIKLNLLFEFSKRLSTAKYKEKEYLNSSTKSGEYFKKLLQFKTVEEFVVAILDSQNRIITSKSIFTGTINEAPVYPREVIRYVLEHNGNSVNIAHNNPGGSLKTSNSDIEVTKKIHKALKTISVNLVDHIIVAENEYYSLAENGLLKRRFCTESIQRRIDNKHI